MSDLSKRFEELMVRMARTDAQLFRTIEKQNMALRRVAEDMLPEATLAVLMDQREAVSKASLAGSSLLPREECSLEQLKRRFRTLAPARAFLEEQMGAPPEGTKRINTWVQLQQAVEQGQWPVRQPSIARSNKPSSGGAMDAMEQRLQTRLERLEQRLERLELLLLQVLEQHSDAATPSLS